MSRLPRARDGGGGGGGGVTADDLSEVIARRPWTMHRLSDVSAAFGEDDAFLRDAVRQVMLTVKTTALRPLVSASLVSDVAAQFRGAFFQITCETTTGRSKAADCLVLLSAVHGCLLLVRGFVPLVSAFEQWLQTRFDCALTAVSLSPALLLRLLDAWVMRSDEQSASLSAEFLVPLDSGNVRRMLVSMPLADVRKLGADSASAAIDALVQQHFNLRVRSLVLSRVGTPLATVNRTGRIKITSAVLALSLLTDVQAALAAAAAATTEATAAASGAGALVASVST